MTNHNSRKVQKKFTDFYVLQQALTIAQDEC